MEEDENNERNAKDDLRSIFRFLIGLQGISFIQQGCNLTTQQHIGFAIIIKPIQGISNVLVGFLLVRIPNNFFLSWLMWVSAELRNEQPQIHLRTLA